VVLPGASMGLGLPFAPARKLLDYGGCLAIATDWNPGSAPMGDLLMQAAVLGASQKLSMAETWAGITFRAAKALDLDDRGTLVHGNLADFIAFETGDYREVLYHQGKVKPVAVWKNGRLVD
ncbi:MAG: amidohydrolase family protein, partial [Imperialibacter sp.]